MTESRTATAVLLSIGVAAGAGLLAWNGAAFRAPAPAPVVVAPPAPPIEVARVPVAAVLKEEPKPAGGAGGGSEVTMFGGTTGRNFINTADKNVIEKPEQGGPEQLWSALLGSRAYGGPIIAGGKAFVGTNNEHPRNKRDVRKNADGEEEPIDKGVLMCFDIKTGDFLWQDVNDKLPGGMVVDWPKEGVCSTPTVEGNRLYYVSNRCTVVCLDVNGLADGNQGIQTEKYKDKTDADVIWEYDLMAELQVFPHNMSACSPLVVGDYIYVVTANGVDENHINIPAPQAPSFVCLEKQTGKMKWKNSLPGKEIMHGQWSNAVYGEIAGIKQVIFPGGDGWLYSFEPTSGELLWKFDANPKDSMYELGGAGTRNDFIGTPVVVDGKVYVGVGQDPEHFTGIGHFWCIDPAGKKGDISPELVDKVEKTEDGRNKMTGKANPNSAVVWHFGGVESRKVASRDFVFGRTMSSAAVVDGLVYIAELQGQLHCLDAKTGKQYWQYDTKGAIWGSAYVVDGKVYLATEGGEMFVFKHAKTPKTFDELLIVAADDKELRAKVTAMRKEIEKEYLVAKVEFDAAIRSTPVVADSVLYVMTEKSLVAFKKK
jgi:outer membrane protein assembly factor BamB